MKKVFLFFISTLPLDAGSNNENLKFFSFGTRSKYITPDNLVSVSTGTGAYVQPTFKFYGIEILVTKEKQGFGLEDYVSFSDTELKSILSIIYAIYLHQPEIRETQSEFKDFLTEQNPYFNISRGFGRILLENLEDHRLEWYQELFCYGA